MHAAKARAFGDSVAARRVLACASPAAAKAAGRAVQGFSQPRWLRIRLGIVEAGCSLKFAAHPDLAVLLAATGEARLVEASSEDAVWACGAGWREAVLAAARGRRAGPGLNLLGRVLERVRAAARRPGWRDRVLAGRADGGGSGGDGGGDGGGASSPGMPAPPTPAAQASAAAASAARAAAAAAHSAAAGAAAAVHHGTCLPKAMRAADAAKRADIAPHPTPRVLAARAAAEAQADAAPAGVDIAAIEAAERRRRTAALSPPEVAFDFAKVRSQSAALLAGQSFADMVSDAHKLLPNRMDPALLQRALGAYPRLDRLLRVAAGADFPLTDGFEPQLDPGFQANYLRNAPFVHEAVVADHASGRCVIISAAAMKQLVADGVLLHVSPSGAVWKAFEQKLRATHNMSCGIGGGYDGSLNSHIDKDLLEAVYGKAVMEDGAVLAGVICACHDASPDEDAPAFCADAKSAFKLVRLTARSAALSCTQVRVTNELGVEEDMVVVATVGSFGGAAMPDLWGAAVEAAQWIAETQDPHWYEASFANFVAQAPPADAPPCDTKKTVLWVDDMAGARSGTRASALLCASAMRAVEFVFNPAGSRFATASTAPGALPRDSAAPLPDWVFDFDWVVVSRAKLFLPDGAPVEYAGWQFNEQLEEVSLSDRGWRRCVSLLWIDLAEGITSVSGALLEKAASALWYYAQGSTILPAFVGELRRLAKQWTRLAASVPLSALAISDLRVWRMVLRAAARRPRLLSFCMRRLAAVLVPAFWIKGDSSFAGAGAWLRWGCALAFDSDAYAGASPLSAFTLTWSSDEREAAAQHMRVHGDINVLECAVLVLSVGTFGAAVEGCAGSYAGDNSSSLAWCKLRRAKGSVVGSGLVKLLCLLIVRYRLHLRFDFCQGVLNQIADALSRLNAAAKRRDLAALIGQRTLTMCPIGYSLRSVVTQVLLGAPETDWLPAFEDQLIH